MAAARHYSNRTAGRQCRTFDQSLAGDGRRGGCRPLCLKPCLEIARMMTAAESTLPLLSARKPPCSNRPGARASHCVETLVVQLHGDAKATMDFIGELTPGRSAPFRTVHVEQTDNHVIRLPLFEQTFNEIPVRRTVVGLQAASGRAVPVMRCPTATPMLLVPKSKVKARSSGALLRQAWSGYQCQSTSPRRASDRLSAF